MKRLSSRRLPRLVAEIHAWPWVDLLLVVLLAFLVLAADGQTGPARDAAPSRRIELAASTSLGLTLDGQPVEQQALIPALARRVKENPALGVVVLIPPGMSAANLLQIMDALRQAGVRHSAVATRPSPPAPSPPP